MHSVNVFVSPQGPRLLPKYRVKSFLVPGCSLETPVDIHLYNSVKSGLVDFLGARSYFGSKVLTPYCYTLGNTHTHTRAADLNVSCSLPTTGLTFVFAPVDVEIKLDEEGYVLPASHNDEVYKR